MSWVDDPFVYVGAPSSTVASPTVTFTPEAQWVRPQRINYYRGSGVPIKFQQSGTAVTIDPAAYEARLGTQDSASPIRFTIGNGKLTDLGSNMLAANPTSSETEALSSTEPIVIELWRTDADDNKTIVGKATVILRASINP